MFHGHLFQSCHLQISKYLYLNDLNQKPLSDTIVSESGPEYLKIRYTSAFFDIRHNVGKAFGSIYTK